VVSGIFSYKVSINSEESYNEDVQRYNPRGFVSVVPDIYVFDVDNSDLKLLIASDGLWNGIYKDTTKVVEMILSLPQDDLTTLCTTIAEKGRENYGGNSIYSKDDITVILVSL
jgi:serine/threonine protein phosphatase PrpC